MVPSATGTYVTIVDYEALEAALNIAVSTAHACFEQLELGELTTSDAKGALLSALTLARYTVTQ